MNNKPSKYYKTNSVFHNNFLEILEDCINESNYNNKQKNEIIKVLYKNFYDCNKTNKIINTNFKARIIL